MVNDNEEFNITETYDTYGGYDFEEEIREWENSWYEIDTVRFNINGVTQNTNELEKYNNWWNEALRAVKNEIWIESDTGGNLTTPTKSDTTQVSNKTKLEAEIRKINEEIHRINPNNKLRINYRINSDDDLKNSIDIVVRDTSHNGFEGTKLLKSDVKIKYTPSEFARKAEINDRLIINLGKYLDIENYTTQLVDDKLVQVEKDKKIGLQSDKKHWYGGKWIAHSPLSISFNTTINENEVLFVNGKKVDVLDQLFFKN